MRFLMLNWRDPKNPLSGGAERVTQGYLEGLLNRGHEVVWFANQFPGAAPAEEIAGIRIVRGGDKGTSILAARAWHRAQPRFDLVIDQHHGLPWYAPWWCRTRCVAYLHEVLGPIWDVFYRWPTSAVGKWQERWTHWLYRNVPFWTASPCTKKGLQAHGVKDVTLIPYGVDTVALPALEPKPLTQPMKLIMVSRLAHNKRIDHGLLALKCLLEKGVAAELTIIGGGDLEQPLHQLAGQLGLGGKVTFAGLLPEREKDERLRGSHWLLHTSLREGWGLNVVEANAMGTPAAVYPVAGLVDSTLHDQTGLLTPDETPEALATVLAASLATHEKYERYRFNAWERAKTFHWSRVLPLACDWLESQARGDDPPGAEPPAPRA